VAGQDHPENVVPAAGCAAVSPLKRRGICRKSQCMTKRKSFLIAMSGGSGSGKSTLAEALLEHLPDGKAVMFGEDAYYLPMSFYGEPATEEPNARP
jgi:type IV secretory pathway ATPase VirB11/archaellum biosynthesis ATPase